MSAPEILNVARTRHGNRLRKTAHVALVMLLSAPACRKDGGDAPVAPAARPVSVVILREVDPVEPLRITGVVRAWMEQDVGFEVSGRVEWITEQGEQLRGLWEENGETIVQGDLLARIDPLSYQAALDAARANVEFSKVRIDKVLPAEAEEARANEVAMQSELDRIQAIPESSRQPIEMIRAQANADMATARVQQAEANASAERATLKRYEAELVDAERDLQHAKLFAPFNAEVAEIYVEAGGYVQRGEPVANLVMMDPAEVEIALSPARAADLRMRDVAFVYLPGRSEPLPASVFKKATVADEDTRTIAVSVITRNVRTIFPRGAASSGKYLLQDFFVTPKERLADDAPLMVEEHRALRRDEKGHFVWADPSQVGPDPNIGAGLVANLKKVYVKPTDRRLNFQGIYLFRILEDPGELTFGTLVAHGLPEDFQGGEVLLVREEWELHPGQLVDVVLDVDKARPGLYVPLDVLAPQGDGTSVLFVERGGTAKRVEVATKHHVGRLAMVEATGASAELLAPGARIIQDHIHFLHEGDSVRVVREEELSP